MPWLAAAHSMDVIEPEVESSPLGFAVNEYDNEGLGLGLIVTLLDLETDVDAINPYSQR